MEISVLTHRQDDYISLTDMAKYKNAEAAGFVISHWLSGVRKIRARMAASAIMPSLSNGCAVKYGEHQRSANPAGVASE